MKILGINLSHNASVCLLIDGEIEFYLEEERLSRKKRDSSFRLCVNRVRRLHPTVDFVVTVTQRYDDDYKYIAKKISESFGAEWIDYGRDHHLCHAANSFYASGFQEANCIVMDGQGSVVVGETWEAEIESVFHFSYPANVRVLDQKKRRNDDPHSLGTLIEAVANKCGWHYLDGGKVMGLSPYGEPSVQLLSKEWETDMNVLSSDRTFNPPESTAEDLCASSQTILEGWTKSKIQQFFSKNICLSGGIFLNCVANRKNLDALDNVFIDPLCFDGGTAIGAAKLLHHRLTGDVKIRPAKSLYLGPPQRVDPIGEACSIERVASLLANGEVVAVFQGRSEGGPRALGNRSILFDPRRPNGKDRVNEVKRRESFRPFAGIILESEAKNWFDMKGVEKSPFMMFAFQCHEGLRDVIPAILHLDGSSRIQTVAPTENAFIHELLVEFEKISGVPILLNTSFNLAGDPLVETQEEALATFFNSSIDHLFFPETATLLSKV